MKKIELVKFIFGIAFCLIAFLGALLFFLGYFNIITAIHDNDGNTNFARIWCGNSSSDNSIHASSFTTIFLAVCGVCGSYLLSKMEVKDHIL